MKKSIIASIIVGALLSVAIAQAPRLFQKREVFQHEKTVCVVREIHYTPGDWNNYYIIARNDSSVPLPEESTYTGYLFSENQFRPRMPVAGDRLIRHIYIYADGGGEQFYEVLPKTKKH